MVVKYICGYSNTCQICQGWSILVGKDWKNKEHRCFPCYGNAASAQFLHQSQQILVTLLLWRWALLVRYERTEKENVWVCYWNPSTPVAPGRLYKGRGASRQKQEQGNKQAFQNCPPSAIRDFAKHISSQTPATCQGSVIYVGLAAWWLHTSEHQTSQYTESCFYLLPGCSLLLRCPKSVIWHVTNSSAKAELTVSNWKHVKSQGCTF